MYCSVVFSPVAIRIPMQSQDVKPLTDATPVSWEEETVIIDDQNGELSIL